MKKFLVGVSILLATIAVKAEYLNWQVGSSMTIGDATYTSGPSEGQYNAVRLYATDGQGSSHYYSIYDAPGTYSTELASGLTTDATTYYIELLNYSGSSYTTVGRTAGTTYAELSGALSNGALSAQAMTAIWTGAAVVATPEPTSGLLLLMGFAMLGLKRKKEV